jgi:hypothetical protein
MGGLKGETGESPVLSRNCKPRKAASQVARRAAFAIRLAGRRCGHEHDSNVVRSAPLPSHRQGFYFPQPSESINFMEPL